MDWGWNRVGWRAFSSRKRRARRPSLRNPIDLAVFGGFHGRRGGDCREGFDADVAVGDGGVIALEHQGAGGFFIIICRGAGGAFHGDVFVDQFSIVQNFDEDSVGGFFAFGVEARSAESDVESLPLTRWE